MKTNDHLFTTCPLANKIWSWIATHNGFSFTCCSVNELWLLDVYIPLKDILLVELIRGVVLWNIWLEMNRIIFKGVIQKIYKLLEDRSLLWHLSGVKIRNQEIF